MCYLENDSNHKFYGVYRIESGNRISPFLDGYNVCLKSDDNEVYYQQVSTAHLPGMPNVWFSDNLPSMTKIVSSFNANTKEAKLKLKTTTIMGYAQRTGEKIQFVGEVTAIQEYNSKARKDYLMTQTIKGPPKESKFEGEVTVIEEYNTKARTAHLKTITKKGTAKESKFEGEVTVIEEYNTKARTDHLKTITKKGTAKNSKLVCDIEVKREYSDQVDKSSCSTTTAISDTSTQKRGLDLLCDAINQQPSKRPRT